MSARRPARLTVYRDDAGEFRWRLRAQNGKIIADSSEGYSRRIDCLAEARSLFDGHTDYLLVLSDDDPPQPA
jgi:uncharacterized protein YegP (UPF0339 family)